MSRVGKHPVKVPPTVTIVQEGRYLKAKGAFGEGDFCVPDCIETTMIDGSVSFTPKGDSVFIRSMWGTVQRRVANLVKGVAEGVRVSVDLVGVGYKASVSGKNIILQLGFSHDIVFPIPDGITVKSEKPTSLVIVGASKQQVGEIAAQLRAYRKPEPYKGKGVIRTGEFVFRKEGKKK